VKRVDLVREIRRAAKARGLTFEPIARTGGPHEMWICDGVRVPVPRHTELSSGVELSIRKDLEEVLGKGWWRR